MLLSYSSQGLFQLTKVYLMCTVIHIIMKPHHIAHLIHDIHLKVQQKA